MRNWWKWLLGILSVLLLVVLLGGWYLSNNWKPIIESKLKELVYNSSDSLYTIQYSDLNINVSFGNISIDSLELIPNAAVYQKLVLAKKAPNNQYHIKLDALRIKHFSVIDVFFNRKLSVSNIVLHDPSIHLIHEYHAYNDTVSSKPKEPFYNHIKHLFESITVGSLNIDSANFRYTTVLGKRSSDMALEKVRIKITDILVDSMSMNDSSRLFYSKMIDVKVPGFSYNLPNGFYKIAFGNLHINTKDKYLEIDDFSFKPRMSKANFFKRKKLNVAMSDVKLKKIRLNELDILSLINKQEIVGQSVEINNGLASFSQNLNYPRSTASRIGQAPFQQLMKVKNKIHFNTVRVNNVLVSYDELSAKYNKDGVITFNQTSGTLTNVTNDRTLLRKNKYMRADFTTQVMNVGKLHVKFGFDMLSNNGSYTYSGVLSPMKATAFNKILVPLVNVEIASGNIKGISFDMQATDYKNWGIFKFDYDSLKVNILGVPKEGKKIKSQKALSFIVNQVLINQSNPDVKGVYHVGLVEYTRVPTFPFFKTMWQSLLQGIVQCAGISAETEAKLLGAADKSMKVAGKAAVIVKDVEKVAVDIGKGIGKAGKAVGKEAGIIGKEVGKEAGKVAHGTDSLFKKIFKKKHKEQ